MEAYTQDITRWKDDPNILYKWLKMVHEGQLTSEGRASFEMLSEDEYEV